MGKTWENRAYIVLLVIGSLLLGFLFGQSSNTNSFSYKPTPLRVSGLTYTKPLLICDSNVLESTPLFKVLQSAVQKEKIAGNITNASVYFQGLTQGEMADVNPDEKFHAGSLVKVPLMAVFYKLAEESQSDFLSKIFTLHFDEDANTGQEIKPEDSIENGKTYTIKELLRKMIIYSDNNSLYALASFVSSDVIDSIFKELKIFHPFDPKNPEDSDLFTTKDISYFFRVLYSSTYLNNNYSEEAMKLLSEVKYSHGIVAGVPSNITVAHKFGLVTTADNGVVSQRELHDCGVVYHPRNPYVICIMTKSSASIASIESAIKNISQAAYNYVDSKY